MTKQENINNKHEQTGGSSMFVQVVMGELCQKIIQMFDINMFLKCDYIMYL